MSLIEKIVCSENIKMAIDNIRKNKGSQTPGTDGKTIEYIIANKEVIIDKIKRELTTNNYRTNTIKRVEIPKGDGKMRPLGIPTIYDRIVQQSFKQILEPIIDKKFHPNSFGFRPKRSTENALALSSNLINRGKMYFVVDIDIKGFFDNINHNKLIKQLYKMGIKDRKIISLIKVMLKTKIKLPCGKIINSGKGTPQGGIISPLLANIVLNEIDWWIDKQWTGIKTRHNYSSQSHKERMLKTTNLSEVKIVRYADDFKIFCRDRQTADKYFKMTKDFLKKRLKLDISKEKSKVINLKKKASEFLGFKIKVVKIKNKFVARTWIREKTKLEIERKLRKQVIIIQKNRDKKQALKFNSLVLGIQNYYKKATMCNRDFVSIGYKINKVLYNRIGKSSYKKDALYTKLYPKYNYRVWNIQNITLFTIQACKFKIPKFFSNKPKTFEKSIEKLIEKQLDIKNDNVDCDWEKMRAIVRMKYNSKCVVSGEYLTG
ncbi:group II intron reverse transcriptase/maturase, partial [Cetobacterium sp.]